jgi:hypothetical protein
MKSQFARDRARDEELLPRWLFLATLIILLLTGAYTLIYNAAEHDRTAKALTETLPDDYAATLRAMINASGNTCEQVCSLTPLSAAARTSSLSVACGAASGSSDCVIKTRFVLTIEPAPEPSR